MRILIAEDQQMGRVVLAGHLRRWGHDVIETCDGQEALNVIVEQNQDIDMLITDWSMPNMDGVELAQRVRQLTKDNQYIYIILLTARNEFNDMIEGFSQGGVDDYIVKPFEGTELQLRIQVGNRFIKAERAQRQINNNLQSIVNYQTSLIQETQDEIVNRLFNALEFREGQPDSGSSVWHIGLLSAAIGELHGWGEERLTVLKSAAPLHDIGKLGIPDNVLRKPGALTPEDFVAIKEHTSIGANLLKDSQNPIIRMGEVIARSHHEYWDGSGYPNGLKGENIAEEARIVSIVDVYTALISERVYRPRFSEDEALSILQAGRGTQFDPILLDLFLNNLHVIKQKLTVTQTVAV